MKTELMLWILIFFTILLILFALRYSFYALFYNKIFSETQFKKYPGFFKDKENLRKFNYIVGSILIILAILTTIRIIKALILLLK